MLLRNFEFFFDQLCSFRYSLWTIKRHFIISSKNSHQSMDSLYSIFSKYCATYKFPDIAFKLNIFCGCLLISCMLYFDMKIFFISQNLSNQLQYNFYWKSTTMNPCSGGHFWKKLWNVFWWFKASTKMNIVGWKKFQNFSKAKKFYYQSSK